MAERSIMEEMKSKKSVSLKDYLKYYLLLLEGWKPLSFENKNIPAIMIAP